MSKPSIIRYCPICKKSNRAKRRIAFVPIYSVEREQRLRKCYRYLHNGEELEPILLNQLVHKRCYSQTVQCLPYIDKNDLNDPNEQIPVNQPRGCISERKKRSCFVCDGYHYSLKNPMKQVLTNYLANKLARGYLRRFKRPYGKPLLDAYVHLDCYRKVYPQRRSYESSNELTVSELLTTPIMINHLETELSARSDLFRPCLQQLTQEDIESYKKRNHDTPMISDSLAPISLSVLEEPTNDQSNQKIYPAAEIRYSSVKSAQSHSLDHDYISSATSQKSSTHFDLLFDWLIDHLKTSEHPISMIDVLNKFKELSDLDSNSTVSNRTHRTRIRTYFEKHYPNRLVFFAPSKYDGTYIAMNDMNYYLRHSVKQLLKQNEIKANQPEVVVPPVPAAEDDEKEICETVMKAVRKVRLYIRDPKQVNCQPSTFLQNFVSLLTASENKFERVSHDYSFYRMIDENLFETNEENPAKRNDKTIRNMSLASDLLSARHDHQISQKHYLLADEIFKPSFHCTPRQVVTLLNRYGHTCSYDSYRRMKASIQQTTDDIIHNLLNEQEKSSISELDSMEL